MRPANILEVHEATVTKPKDRKQLLIYFVKLRW